MRFLRLGTLRASAGLRWVQETDESTQHMRLVGRPSQFASCWIIARKTLREGVHEGVKIVHCLGRILSTYDETLTNA